MTARPDKTPTKSLRDAYKVSAFRVRARIDSYDELDHPAFVITLDRRSKNGVRRARDLGCGDREVYLDFHMHRVTCTNCGVKNEKLAFLSDNTKYTLRFAMQIGGLCRAMTITDVARRMHLDWHTVKELDKLYMREQLARAGPPTPNVIGVDEISIEKRHVYRIVVSDLERKRAIWFGGTGRSEQDMDMFYAFL